jgi:hypothetical protein
MKKNYFLTLFTIICFCTISFGQSKSTVVKKSIKEFSVFPNPVKKGKITITTFNATEKEVSIYSVLGKRVFIQKFTGKRKQLDISEISSGIYIMKVLEGNNIATKKVVIK